MRIIDISLTLRRELPQWPGDVPFEIETRLRRDKGGLVNLSRIRTSLHFGTHADAPFHFDDDGKTIDQIDPAAWCGPALVVDVQGRDPIDMGAFAKVDLKSAPRLLLKTCAWIDHTRFPERIPVLSPDAPAALAAKGITLIGVDVPSVDRFNSDSLPNHHALGKAGILIIENLDLRDVKPGLYELFAAPLKIAGADGAPLRAVLVQR